MLNDNQLMLVESTLFLNEANKVDKDPLSSKERAEINKKFSKIECSFAKHKGQFYCYTHRARSKFYDNISDIPQKTVDFINSTG